MIIPSATYRIQFNKDFTFKDLNNIVSYLDTLGISTVYASPILKAVPGSMHGYDVADPHTINPEIGTLDELKKIAGFVKEKKMQWLQDIVPNHMAFDLYNERLKDVLERGRDSEYHLYFDIDWNHPAPELNGKLMVPFLGDELDSCIKNKEIEVSFSEDGFTIAYYDYKFPLSAGSIEHIGKYAVDPLKETISTVANNLKKQAAAGTPLNEWKKHKRNQYSLLQNNESYHKEIEKALARLNDDTKEIKKLLADQYYVLTFWKHTEAQINYRRFFTVNSLICLRMEDNKVFSEYHSFIHSLFKENILQGLRIDHIDGLLDPSQYIKNLRHLFGDSCYIIAEKILEAREEMPEHWPLQGTSGYEFLSYVSQLFTSKSGAKQLASFYRDLVPDMPAYDLLVYENKKLILENHMCGEWENLAHYFDKLQLLQHFNREKIKQAIALLMLSLPVYRIYPERIPLEGKSLAVMTEAFKKAMKKGPSYQTELEYMHDLFTKTPSNHQVHDRIMKFLKRLMQFTGPLTAKGVEDTTFYVYNPLISHDEVGDAPSTLGISIQEFHNKMLLRQKLTPFSLNATATHDTKRGEDARLRLNVLSEFPDKWKHHVKKWMTINKKFRTELGGQSAPTVNDEYFIYQSVAGGFPEDFNATEEWLQRVKEYIIKAVREAKVNSNWKSPNEEYERACTEFIQRIFDQEHEFIKSFVPFVKMVCNTAYLYAATQALIKITAPGIPDIYRGCELWDLSFVDPDNRRPVDFEKRMTYLNDIMAMQEKGTEALFTFLRNHRNEGLEKLFVIWKSLNFRRHHNDVFLQGEYLPISITGKEPEAVAYARRFEDQWLFVVVPLNLAHKDVENICSAHNWEGFSLELPTEAPKKWQNIFTNEMVNFSTGTVFLKDIFNAFPAGFYVST